MITAVTSWRGRGATTTALLLAAEMASATPTWLIEADPAGGVLAGRIDVAGDAVAGLERIAFGATGPAEEIFAAVAQSASGVRVVTSPSDPFRAHMVHRPRVPWPAMLSDLDGEVVVDIGRQRPGMPVGSVLAVADALVVTTSPEVTDVVTTAEWLRSRGRSAEGERGFGDMPCLVAVVASPGGVAFSEHAIRADLGAAFGAWLAWEPSTVDLVQRGLGTADRRLRRSALCAGVRRLASNLREVAEVAA